ncbi:uncharacterized protein LOC120104120 [Phoenix dactylifera]|uniref:Uncharacterized protein LOC120104120 n=1 Tax=Phoenix dactylifera TaxID=42345 RepID=A0A8B8ZBA1_PHODC|nr:uncharacterized protein LOC120104120 [Phoenix dactylifera]
MVISEGSGNPWVLAAVYASTEFRERRVLWEEASHLIGQGHPLLMAGDFNCIVGSHEKMGGKPFTYKRKIKEFQEFLDSNGLVDLGFSGPQFTWCNNQQGWARVWERLDRACATAGWVQCFPEHHVRHLPRIASDHYPLLVSTEALIPICSPFRFEKFWLCYPRSWEMVREAWSVPVRGDAMYRMSRRLELTRRRLRRWNREEVGNIFRGIEDTEEAITRLQTQEVQSGGLSEEEMGELRSHLALHDSLLRQQEILWRQKSRVQWIVEGDRNTRFFHQATLIRRHQNRIRVIRGEDGQLSEDPDMIPRILESFFRARWTEEAGGVSPVDIRLPSVGVTEEETAALIRPVSEREIRETVWSLEGDKAPGPDGFPPLFFRRYWTIVGQDVIAAIPQFFSTATLSTDWQRTFITLIPKRQDATEPSHFRPISLCTTLYKATTKILAVRLRDILPRLISPEQGAFVGGRSITDNVLIAQEFIGLRQGCPLSPLLFIICADALSRALRQAVSLHELEVYRPVEGATPISHMLFADDCLLLARSNRQAAGVISRILQDYCAVSGQCINFSKSAICFSPKTTLAVKNSILEILGVGEQEGTLRYLGIPLSGRRLRSRDCSSLELSIRHRLEGWQMHTLSMMGRITLVRSVLSLIPTLSMMGRITLVRSVLSLIPTLSMMGRIMVRSVLSLIPTYFLSNSFIPVVVLRTLEQLFRNFIWGRSRGRGGIYLLAWEVVCQPTRLGGLGLQSLVVRREALAARHVARFMLEPDSMWSSLMRAKYGLLLPGTRAGSHHSPVWREMCARAMLVLPEIRWAIGEGRSINVLEDCWVTELPISCLPTMVDSARLSGYRVCDLLDLVGGQWRAGLIREVLGEQLAELVLALSVPAREEPDRLVWMPSGQTRVRARDLHVLCSREPARQIEGGWIWRMRVHPRVALFIWKVAWGCLPTRSMLARRGVRVTQFCQVCMEIEETIDHAPLQCPRAREIWSSSPAPLPQVMESTQDLIHLLRVSMRSPRFWEEGILRAYLAYHIWLDRNAGIFEGRRLSPRMVADRAVAQAREATAVTTLFSTEMARDIWGTLSAVVARKFAYVSWAGSSRGSAHAGDYCCRSRASGCMGGVVIYEEVPQS